MYLTVHIEAIDLEDDVMHRGEAARRLIESRKTSETDQVSAQRAPRFAVDDTYDFRTRFGPAHSP